jgi:hypothetical protein
MSPQVLLDLLHQVLDGRAAPEALHAALEAPGVVSPETAAELLRALEDRYVRGGVHYELYLLLKDQLQVHLRPRSTRPPPRRPATTTSPPAGPATSPTVPPAPDRTRLRMPTEPSADRTQFRAPSAPPPDRTQLRVPTSPAATVAAGARPRELPEQAPSSRPAFGPPGPRSMPGTDEPPEVRTWVSEVPLEPGAVIKERFVLEQRLGEGGMGVVFKARDLRKEEARDRDPFVAIKFLSSEFRRHPEAFMALQRESRRAQALAHPNVVTVHDFDRDGTLIYMTMEFLEGEPLDRFIQRHPQGLRFKEAWPIVEGCARALAYAHEEGVVHADFKPGNVFVAGKGRVKVLDFGIARAVTRRGDAAVTGTRFDAGSLGALTPAYASPEMLLNDQPDPRDDVYALACVTFELLTGRHPFDGQPAVKAAHDGMTVRRAVGMGRRAHRALVHGLAFRQSDRTPTIEAFLDELAGPLGARGRALRQSLVSIVATVVIVAGLAAGAWWLTRADPDEQLRRQLADSARAQVEESSRRSGQVPEVDAELRNILLEQGRDYVKLATGGKFDPVILSEGVSSAYGAYVNVLRMDPSSTEALDGLVEIVRLYEREAARALEEGDAARAAELAGYGLKIQPTRDALIDLRSRAEAELGQKPP